MIENKANIDKTYNDNITNNPLSKKINKIIDYRLENDKETLNALKQLSSFFKENSIQSRRNLRGKIEQQSVEISEKFVNALKDVKEAVDKIHDDVMQMNSEFTAMKTRLEKTKSETRHLIQQTNALDKQSKKLKLQEEMVTHFVEVFQLSQNDLCALKGDSNNEITSQFFHALIKMQEIRNNSKYLIQTGEQKTALEIMDQLNTTRENALERLFKWAQVQARAQEPSNLMPKAMAALYERPLLFKMVIEEWTVIHRGWLNRGFLDALTLGSSTSSAGSSRPIELQSHDPLRYVGDMLAWIHQALPSEKEAAQTLLSSCPKDEFDLGSQSCQIVSNISEALCRPLKTRIEQLVLSQQGRADSISSKRPLHLYKICGILHFYKDTIMQVTGKGLLISTLDELHQLTHKMFLGALQNQVSAFCDHILPPTDTFTPCPSISKTLALLTEIITAPTVSDDPSRDLEKMINCVVDPLLTAVHESGATLGPVENSVYILNCLHQLHSTLSLLHASQEKLDELKVEMDAKLEVLSDEQVKSVFQAMAFDEINSVIMGPGAPPVPLSALPSCQSLAIQTFVAKLDGFLAAPDYIMLPHTKYLLSSTYRKQAFVKTVQSIVASYSRLYSLVNKSENGYQDPSTLMPKTVEQIQALLL